MHSPSNENENEFLGTFTIGEGNQIQILDQANNPIITIPGSDDFFVNGFPEYPGLTLGQLAYHASAQNLLHARSTASGTQYRVVDPKNQNIILDPRRDNNGNIIPSYFGPFHLDKNGISTCVDTETQFTKNLDFNDLVSKSIYPGATLEHYRWHANNGSFASITQEFQGGAPFFMLVDPITYKEISPTTLINTPTEITRLPPGVSIGPFEIKDGNKILIHDLKNNRNLTIPGSDNFFVDGFNNFPNVTIGHLAFHARANNFLKMETDGYSTRYRIVNRNDLNKPLDPTRDYNGQPITSYFRNFTIDEQGISTFQKPGQATLTLNFNNVVNKALYPNSTLDDYRWHSKNGSFASVTVTGPEELFFMLVDPHTKKELFPTMHTNSLIQQHKPQWGVGRIV